MINRSITARAGESRLNRERTPGEFLPVWSRREMLGALALIVAVFVVYLPVWNAGFVWDDVFYLQESPNISGLRGLAAIWTTGSADISPFMLTTLWVEHALWGFEPLPYHLVDVLLHGACAVLLWRVLLALNARAAWLGAALWALHPVNVESVAWVIELKNTESGLFFLAAILFYLRWLKAKEGYGAYVVALLFGTLAMATKTTTCVLPSVLCLAAWWMEGRWQWRNLIRVAPFFLPVVAAAALSLWKDSVALTMLTDPTLARTWPERFVTAGIAVWFYLGKLAWPCPVMTVYPRWHPDASMASSYLPLLEVVLALFLLWLKRGSWARAPFFAFTYFLCALLPALGLFDAYIYQYSLVFDHFQYLPSMGPLALAAAGLVRLADGVLPGKMRLQAGFAAILLLVLGLLSWQRAVTFHSEETLWADTAAKDPTSTTAHFNLGVELERQGHIDEAKLQYRRVLEINPAYTNARVNLALLVWKEGGGGEALAEVRLALALNPRSGEAYNALGYLLMKQGHQDEATAALKTATEISPRLAKPHLMYGQILLQKGELDHALLELGTAMNLNPSIVEIYDYMGSALTKKGSFDAAIAAYEKCLELDPGNVDAYDNLGQLLIQKGQLNDGVIQYQKALEINPKSAMTETDLGAALFQAGLKEEAMKHLRKALDLDPTLVQANNNLGNALLATGQTDAAIAQYQKTSQLDPNFADVRRNLGLALLIKGRTADAIFQLQEAMRLNPGDRVAQGMLQKAQSKPSH
jgi:tetratricopeptide (TPR) repeat protein